MRINYEAGEMPKDVVVAYKCEIAKYRHEPEVDLAAKVRELEARLMALNAQSVAATPVAVPKVVVARPGNRYRLLSTDVSWATQAQVHSMMAIIAAHVNVGEVFNEEEMVVAMDANPGVLVTTQGAKKIWNYYKGTHDRGLEAHGNIVKV